MLGESEEGSLVVDNREVLASPIWQEERYDIQIAIPPVYCTGLSKPMPALMVPAFPATSQTMWGPAFPAITDSGQRGVDMEALETRVSPNTCVCVQAVSCL